MATRRGAEALIRHLPYFVAVAEAETLHEAAKRLHIAPSALSRRMRDLEQEIGAMLLLRSKNGMALTESGQALLRDARAMLEQLAVAGQRARALAQGELGHLRIGFNEVSARQGVLKRALQDFRARYPGVTLELTAMVSDAQVPALRAGSLDVGFLSIAPQDDRLGWRELARDGFLLALPATHPLAVQPVLRLADLRGEKFIWYIRKITPALHDEMIARFRAAGITPQIGFETFAIDMVCDLVGMGMGIGFVVASHQGRAPADVVLRPVADFDLTIAIGIAWPRADASEVLARFLESVEEANAA